MKKQEKLYEGKAKILYATDNPDLVVQYFKDDATAFNAQKKGTIVDKGVMNNKLSTTLFEYLAKGGIKTHFVEKLSDREMLCKKVSIVPVEVVVRNVLAGSLAKKLGMEEGVQLKQPVIEFYYKDDALGDPMINADHVLAFGWATKNEIDWISDCALKVDVLLIELFARHGIRLVDFKLEFGKHKGEVILADEISPDTSRLWDMASGEKMDKDRFRRDLGKVEESYAEVVRRICG
ncbi:MAG: phosphoribosylaminoimidazolesuccinocarboxamide synthase [Nitrospinae bacterium]|nr:phosphoribosylaminoimidazolesuccinocarboxamide synthase [Nitrospinota bacterium]